MLKVPGTTSSYIIVEDCSVMDRERVSIAIQTFIKKWEEKFPTRIADNKKVRAALDSLLSTFNSEEKFANAYTVDGMYGEKLSLGGLTLSPGWIWVKAHPGDRLCQTSFIHELIHVAIWAIKKEDGDPDHLGSKYPGWTLEHNIIIQDTKKILCAWGI